MSIQGDVSNGTAVMRLQMLRADLFNLQSESGDTDDTADGMEDPLSAGEAEGEDRRPLMTGVLQTKLPG